MCYFFPIAFPMKKPNSSMNTAGRKYISVDVMKAITIPTLNNTVKNLSIIFAENTNILAKIQNSTAKNVKLYIQNIACTSI
jgi:hypothetical protein